MDMQKHPKIAVAMSGGVDSSIAAALLMQQGFDVFGLTMNVMKPQTVQGAAGCPSAAAVAAGRVAERLGIPHHVVDLSAEFEKEIVAYFVGEYAVGRTPNPCVRCNRVIKFQALFEQARRLGAECLATGHYARIEERDGGFRLLRGRDRSKDQSYMLANLTQAQLRRALFPLGGETKERTRRLARDLGFSDVHLPDSQEVCFIPDDDYRAFLETRLGPFEPGPIISSRGEILGTHQGLTRYTVGQRKGLGIAAPRPLYVLRLDTARNALIVGFEEETWTTALTAVHANWVGGTALDGPVECEAQVRYRQQPVACTAAPDGAEGFTVTFHKPVRSVAPGQWAALYAGECVLGGGVIDHATPAAPTYSSVREQEKRAPEQAEEVQRP